MIHHKQPTENYDTGNVSAFWVLTQVMGLRYVKNKNIIFYFSSSFVLRVTRNSIMSLLNIYFIYVLDFLKIIKTIVVHVLI